MPKLEDFEVEIIKLKDRMNRLLDDYSEKQIEPLNEAEWEPDLDVLEDKDDIIVKADIPGMSADLIDVTISEKLLRIRGERKRDIGREDENYHYIGRRYGKFDRRIALPVSIDAENVKASYKDGVLTVRLPKLEKKKTGELKIQME
jgi:HSP20 family protein